MMKLFKIMTTLCILLSFLSSSCASANKDGQHGHGAQVSTPPGLPRKLKVNEEAMVKGSEKKDVMVETPKKHNNEGLSAGKSYKQETKNMHGNRGSSLSSGKGLLLDEGDELEFFTMDYRRVRRRRPVHNKSMPTSSSTTP